LETLRNPRDGATGTNASAASRVNPVTSVNSVKPTHPVLKSERRLAHFRRVGLALGHRYSF